MIGEVFEFESIFSGCFLPELEYDVDYISECPPDFDDEADALAAEALSYSLGVI